MNRELDTGRVLSTKLSRRDFLKLAAATAGIAALQTGCNALENLGTRLVTDCLGHPRLEIPSSYIDDLRETISPLTKLMPPATAESLVIKVIKNQSVNYRTVRGCALRRNNEIRIYMPDDPSPELLEQGKVSGFHEAAHILDHDEILSDYLKQEMKNRMRRNKYAPYEFKILKESSYCYINSCMNKGHPESNFGEVFAGSITILRFFPFEFIKKTEELSSPESKRFLATNGRVCIDALKRFSAIPVEDSDLPFDPQLISYLTQQSQK